MNEPDRDRSLASKIDPPSHPEPHNFPRALLCATALAIAYLALMPHSGASRFRIVPLPLYRWLSGPEHDDFVNIAAFGFFAGVVFYAGPRHGARAGLLGSIFEARAMRLAGLLALVCAIELVQKWIPGRISSMDDVCSGWSGIFAAWLLSVLWDARGKSAA